MTDAKMRMLLEDDLENLLRDGIRQGAAHLWPPGDLRDAVEEIVSWLRRGVGGRGLWAVTESVEVATGLKVWNVCRGGEVPAAVYSSPDRERASSVAAALNRAQWQAIATNRVLLGRAMLPEDLGFLRDLADESQPPVWLAREEAGGLRRVANGLDNLLADVLREGLRGDAAYDHSASKLRRLAGLLDGTG